MTERQIQKANEHYDRLQNADKILALAKARFMDCAGWATIVGVVLAIYEVTK